jgi:hypothetical protein
MASTYLTACKAENSLVDKREHKAEKVSHAKVEYHKLNIKGDAVNNGIFDISVEYGDDNVGWMAYSRVILPKYVETRIAKSTDRGKTWHYVTTVNKSSDGHITIKGKKREGAWRNETPTLLYDPQDKPGRRWKLFYQRYLSVPPYKKGNSLFDHGWIEYRYAKNPAGPWSKPIRLFCHEGNQCEVHPNKLNRSLRQNAFYNELGAIAVNGVIYLSADASTTATGVGEWRKRKVVLFASKDHGESWRFVGTLTDYKDAGDFGYLIFTGSSLVREGNRLYLLVTPAGKKGLFVKNRSHDGTYVIGFDDISQARLKRDKKGKLIVHKILSPEKGMHSGGLSDYHEKNTNGGIMFSQLSTDPKHRPEFFQVFSTGERLR